MNLEFIGGKLSVDMTDEYIPNGEWKLLDIETERLEKIYDCCPEAYISVSFILVIKRQRMYYFFNLVVPCGLIGIDANYKNDFIFSDFLLKKNFVIHRFSCYFGIHPTTRFRRKVVLRCDRALFADCVPKPNCRKYALQLGRCPFVRDLF